MNNFDHFILSTVYQSTSQPIYQFTIAQLRHVAHRCAIEKGLAY
jgi:hypothetical protein